MEHRSPVAAVVVSEGILIKVRLQMLGAHGMVDPVDPALQKTPKTIDSVGVNIADHVHPLRRAGFSDADNRDL